MVESQRGMEEPIPPRNQPKANPGLVHAAAVGVDVFLAIGLNMHIHNGLGKLFSQIVLHFRGNVVCFRHRNVGVNLDVEVEHKHHAVAAGA